MCCIIFSFNVMGGENWFCVIFCLLDCSMYGKKNCEVFSILNFSVKGWKNEDVVVDFLNARVIRVKPNDSKVWWKKVSSLLEVVNKDLGYYDVTPNCEHCQVRLVSRKKKFNICLPLYYRYIYTSKTK